MLLRSTCNTNKHAVSGQRAGRDAIQHTERYRITSRAPGALAVPVVSVAGFAIEVGVVVAAVPCPVESPCWIEELAGAPVIVRDGRGHGLCDGSCAQAGEPQTGGHYDC
jgi:hypothetical protein